LLWCPDLSKIWILRDYARCSGCRLCEVACALKHEGVPDPTYSRIKVSEFVPGFAVPQLCSQCPDYPCVNACKFGALSVDEKTGAVLVDENKCTLCRACIYACPANIPRIVPGKRSVLICDLCGGDPECVKVCSKLGYNVLVVVPHPGSTAKLYAQRPDMVSATIASKTLKVELVS